MVSATIILDRENPMLAKNLVATLAGVSTGTITTVLLKKGIRRSWMRGPKVFAGSGRIVGEAFTLRFVPAREDLATPESWASPRSTRAAIEDMPEGVIAVADAMGVSEAGRGSCLCRPDRDPPRRPDRCRASAVIRPRRHDPPC